MHKYSLKLAPEHAVYAWKFFVDNRKIAQWQKQLLSSFEVF